MSLPRTLFCLCSIALVSVLVACSGKATQGERAEIKQEPDRKVYTRDEFRALVMDKTEAEIVQALGKPDDTGEGDVTRTLVYRKVSKDPATDKVDDSVMITIRRKTGKAISVSF